MHAIVEAGLNHLLKVRLNDPKLIKIVLKSSASASDVDSATKIIRAKYFMHRILPLLFPEMQRNFGK